MTTITPLRPARTLLAAALASTLALGAPAFADGAPIVRTELFRADLAGQSGTEIIAARLELQPGATVPRHSHHGTEHLVVIDGGSFAMGNGEAVTFAPGMALDFARDEVHGGLTVTSEDPVVVFTLHVVDKGAPLNVPAQ